MISANEQKEKRKKKKINISPSAFEQKKDREGGWAWEQTQMQVAFAWPRDPTANMHMIRVVCDARLFQRMCEGDNGMPVTAESRPTANC